MKWIKNDWKNNRFVFIMENINMLANIGQSLYTSLFLPNVNWWIIYGLYTTGSIAGILFSIKRKTMPLLVLNITFTIFNTIGIIKLIAKTF